MTSPEMLVGRWQLEKIVKRTHTVSGGLEQLEIRPTSLTELPTKQDPPPSHPWRSRPASDGTLELDVFHTRRGRLHALVEVTSDRLRWRWGTPDGTRPVSLDEGGDLELYVRVAEPPVAEPIERDTRYGRFLFAPGAQRWRSLARVRAGHVPVELELVGPDTLDRAALEALASRLDTLPIEALAVAAVEHLHELAELVARGGEMLEGAADRDPKDATPLVPTLVSIEQGATFVAFEEGIELEVDAGGEIVDSSLR